MISSRVVSHCLQGSIFARECMIDDSRLPPMMAAGDYLAKLAHFTTVNNTERFMLETTINAVIRIKSYAGR